MFGRKKNKEEKKGGKFDKIIMGAIVGTAIGSVVGLTMAPKKGEDSRQYLKDQYQNRGEIKEIGKLTKETVTGVGALIKNFIFRKKKSNQSIPSAGAEQQPPAEVERRHESMKKIPFEAEVHNTFEGHQD